MRSGTLSAVITLQHATEAPNASGRIVASWATTAIFRAAVVEEAANDTAKPEAINGKRHITIRCRERDDVELASRVLYRGRAYEVVEIKAHDRRVLEIRAVAKDAA
jgi:SPP1 family predicted phage head-tail adaptor